MIKFSSHSNLISKWVLFSSFIFLINSTPFKAIAQVLPYLDKQFSCITQDQALKYKKDFNVDLRTFGGQELCNPVIDFKKLTNDLSIIEYGKFETNSQNGLIGKFVDPAKYYLWMKAQTRGMNRGNDIPTATAYNSGGYFTMQDGWARLSTLGRVGTVIHEARHTEGYRHIPCSFGPYAGVRMDGCDRDLQYGGSHGVEMEYYARVSVYGNNFHPVYKAMARLMAMARSNFVFNNSPMQKREGLLVQTEQGNYWLFDNNKWVYRSAITPQDQNQLRININQRFLKNAVSLPGYLKRTSFGASLFNGSQAFAIDLYERYEPSTALTDTYSYFKILLDLKTSLKDFEEFDIGIKRYLAQVNQQNQISTFNYGKGRWNSAKNLNFQPAISATFLPTGQAGYFLIDTQGNTYAYNTEQDAMILTNHKWDTQAIAYSKVNNQVFSLSKENRLFFLNNNTWQEIQLPQNQKPIQMVSVPLYNIFTVTE